MIVYPDYRLLQPSTCYDQLEDISDMLSHLSSDQFAQELSSHLPPGRQMDLDKISVAGFSAGSYIARILVVHSLKRKTRIQFKSCVLFYGMGGDFLLDYWVEPRISPETPPPDRRIDENEIADCPYSTHLPGYGEAERRTPWCEWWWDTARFLDLCTGEEGLSDELRKSSTTDKREEYMLERKTERRSNHNAYSYEDIFPQLYLRDGSKAPFWPKTMLIHGTSDPSVMLEETMHTWNQLNQDDQKHRLVIVKGGNHDLNDCISGKPLEDKVKALEDAVVFIKDTSA